MNGWTLTVVRKEKRRWISISVKQFRLEQRKLNTYRVYSVEDSPSKMTGCITWTYDASHVWCITLLFEDTLASNHRLWKSIADHGSSSLCTSKLFPSLAFFVRSGSRWPLRNNLTIRLREIDPLVRRRFHQLVIPGVAVASLPGRSKKVTGLLTVFHSIHWESHKQFTPVVLRDSTS
jgi:hypothetical protein